MGACLVVLISTVSENQAGGGTEDSFTVSWDGWKVNWIGFGDGLDTREDLKPSLGNTDFQPIPGC